ncbi:MAG: 5-(carboxyamino)imidazole ribonucleotide synthase [Lysobacteraceae bacterium]
MSQATVGILGGGQLARMLALAGAPLGLRLLVLDNLADACAAQVAPLLKADFRDADALARFAERIDVATFDFENVPADSAQWLAARIPVHPSPAALAVAQDRLAEKSLFLDLGIATPRFSAVASRVDLDRALADIGAPAILKTRRLGYDGKGQFRLRDESDADAAWAALGAQCDQVGLILEAFVEFRRELSVIAVRGRDGEFRTWPLTRNWHLDGILCASLAPARVNDALAARAEDSARRIAEALDYVGVFALELFDAGDGLLANEMAPRVHNSGHWTIEAAACSQFENHLRAILGLPLGSTAARGVACMLNWVGELPDPTPLLRRPGGHWHDYGKPPRPGRKVGHATVVADSEADLAGQLAAYARDSGLETMIAPVLAALRGEG